MKKLTLVKSNIMESSEYHQFYLGILLQNKEYINEVYNKQIGLLYNKYNKTLSSPLSNAYNFFTDTSLEIEGILLGKSWDMISGGSPHILPDLIWEKLNKNYYVKYTGDLFYIKSKLEYNVKHFWTDIFIIGFNDTNFIAVGKTKNNCFEEYFISSNEIISSAEKRKDLDIYNEYTYSFELDFYKLKDNSSYSINKDKIKKQLYKYLNPIQGEKYCSGVDVYPIIVYEWRQVGIINEQMSFIRDHIHLMYQRIIALSQIINIPNSLINDYHNIDLQFTELQNYLSLYKLDKIIETFNNFVVEEKRVLSKLTDFI